MVRQFKKLFGENPEQVQVLSQTVLFDDEGLAEVDEDVAAVLEQIPGYEEVAASEAKKAKESEPVEEETPSKAAPRTKRTPPVRKK